MTWCGLMPKSLFFECRVFKPVFPVSLFTFIKRFFKFLFAFCHKGDVICLQEDTDISPSNLDSSLCFIQPSISHDILCIEKQSGNIQPWCTLFPVWNQSILSCQVLTVASWPAGRFLRRQGRWSGILISLRIFQFVVINTVKGFNVVMKQIFLEFFCFFYDPGDVGNLISGSSTFSKPRLYIGNFSVYILLKPSLKDLEHYLASMWNECNCAVVWTCFGIAFLWNWNEDWPFPILWPLLSFPSLLAY